MPNHWYVLHVKPHKERSVHEYIEAIELDVFYPRLKVKPVNPRASHERPFFPGYMFVKLDLDELGANALRWTEGTHGLVQFGGEPAIVPENLIAELRQKLERIQAAGGIELAGLKKGDRVKIVSGTLAGYEAIFDAALPGKDRVQVLLAYLSDQPKRLQIEASQIKKIRR
jgi:transcriptional antiterminator RfaH